MASEHATTLLEGWPEDSREAAQIVIDTYGEPSEATESLVVWHAVGPWKRVVATLTYYEHQFTAPHIDAVESFIDYRVPPDPLHGAAPLHVRRNAGGRSRRPGPV